MDYIKFLGANGAKTATKGALSILIAKRSVIDAGNIIMGLSDRAALIENIFLTHSHMDHIADIPFISEERVISAIKPLKIYGSRESLNVLKNSILNNKVWPDFTKIPLQNSNKPTLELIEIEFEKEYQIEDISILATKTNHIAGSCGYVVKKGNQSIFITSDTYICDNIWQKINSDKSIHSVCIDVSFPSRYEKLAFDSKHLTPKLLKEELKKLKRAVSIYPIHLKPQFCKEIIKELKELHILKKDSKVIQDGDIIYFDYKKRVSYYEIRGKFDFISKNIYDVAIALSNQKDTKKLLKMILKRAKEITNSDGGTIYLLDKEKSLLNFLIVESDSIDVDSSSWGALPLYDKDGSPNKNMVAAVCALEKRVINIEDVYQTEEFDFSGTKEFDKKNNYRSKSMLVVPLLNHEDEVIGVLQLINKKDSSSILSFSSFDEKITLALASIAATAITKDKLIEDLERLFESFLDTINVVIEKKSKHTAGHIKRVVDITLLLAEAINKDRDKFRDIHYSKEELQEIKLAALMHDIGKIGIPEYIMNKATKLQTIYDKIEEIKLKAELLKKDIKISFLQKDNPPLPKKYYKEIKEIDNQLNYLIDLNTNEAPPQKDKVLEIAKREINLDSKTINWLSSEDVENLLINQGTLNKKEKEIIKSHAKIGAEILETLPFPKKYSNVAKIATAHHEKLDGSGYPKGLKAKEISFEARILAIADIFDALLSDDRPYKKKKTPSEAMEILSKMARDGLLDKDLVSFLYKDNLYLKIAKRVFSQT